MVKKLYSLFFFQSILFSKLLKVLPGAKFLLSFAKLPFSSEKLLFYIQIYL